MRRLRALGLAALVLACGPWGNARGGWGVGVGVGYGPYYRPYYRPYYGGVRVGVGYYGPYYPYYPYYPPPPVVVAPPPVVVQPPPPVQPVNPPPAAPAAQPESLLPPRPIPASAAPPSGLAPAVTAAASNPAADMDTCLQQLRSPQEKERADALVQLGRLKADRAVGPMVKALKEDPSPVVREAAARGLGLVGAPWARAALERAALSDADADVRHSAGFAAEVIRGNPSR